MRQVILGKESNLVVDLRHLNKVRRVETFKVFFDTMETKIYEISVADEHRHGVAHLSNFISLRDLIEQITNDCPTGTPIPRKTTILFAFTPKIRISKPLNYTNASSNSNLKFSPGNFETHMLMITIVLLNFAR